MKHLYIGTVLTMALLFCTGASMSLHAQQTETMETETETETELDERTVWYMQQIPAVQTSDNADGLIEEVGDTRTAPERLMQLAAQDSQTHEDSQSDVRKKITRYMNRYLDISISEDQALHYVYTDEADYVVVYIGQDDYIFQVTYKTNGKSIVSQADPDEQLRQELLSITGFDISQTDEHYWNGITSSEEKIVAPGDLPCSDDNIMAVPYFNQGLGYWDGTGWLCTDWPDYTFNLNGHTMHEAACGFFSAAMAISYLKQEIISPVEFKENGQYIGDGAAVTVGLESAGMYDIRAVMTGSWEEAYAALKAGHPVMENVGPGVFTNYGHYILLIGILPDGSIAVNDPGNQYHTYWHSWTVFDTSTIADSQKGSVTAFTIFG